MIQKDKAPEGALEQSGKPVAVGPQEGGGVRSDKQLRDQINIKALPSKPYLPLLQ